MAEVAEVAVLRTEEVAPQLLADIRGLMDVAFADDEWGAFDDDDWAHTLGGRHVVVTEGSELLAHAALVERVLHGGDRPFRTGYVEGVATRPGRHGEGLGSLAMVEVTAMVRRDFELGALGTGRWSFYERLGWERWQGETFVRHPDGQVARTAEDDNGVMVLRTGPSEALDLTSPLACESRPGDDW